MTKSQSYPIIGTAMEGGFFGGIINVNGTHKGIIWAPKSAGQIEAQLMPRGMSVEFSKSPCDCVASTKTLLDAGSPAAKIITDLDINGFKDWLIPSRDVLEIAYRNLKPATRKNYCSSRDGENANSVPPTYMYLPDNPLQTSVDLFKEGGAEAFDPLWYWSSTVRPEGDTAVIQTFFLGRQHYFLLHDLFLVRAVRLIQL